MKVDFFLADEAAQIAMGARLGQVLDQGVVYLEGDLGSGKTTLTRGLIQSLGHQGAVKSPTYTLVEPYLLNGRCIYHFDLYRLADPEELEYIGIRDYFDEGALCLVEWPGKGKGYLPVADLHLHLHPEGAGRRLTLEACTPPGEAALSRLTQQVRSE